MSLVSRWPWPDQDVHGQRCRVGVPGWVYRVGNRGAIPGTTQLLGEGCRYSGAGPGSPGTGLEWVVSAARAPSTSGTTPSGPGRSLRALPVPPRADAASWPIRARIRVLFCKVSQNGRVSPEKCQKAYHSPCFQNRPQKSPLDILRFPFSAAFSHKELLGLFDA